ncbi:MAG: hypothetical protein ACPL0A_03805, partial [Candidatus Micrarchaeia archaeon]
PLLEGPYGIVRIFAVFDGVSESAYGRYASNAAKSALSSKSEDCIKNAVLELINRKSTRLLHQINNSVVSTNYETTMALAILHEYNNELFLHTFNAGDSPIFVIKNNVLLPVYADDSECMHYERIGRYTKEYTNYIKLNGLRLLSINPAVELDMMRIFSRWKNKNNLIVNCLPLRNRYLFHHTTQISKNDFIIIGSDGFIPWMLIFDFEMWLKNMCREIVDHGQERMKRIVKATSEISWDDSTGILVYI